MANAYENNDGSPKYGERVESTEAPGKVLDELLHGAFADSAVVVYHVNPEDVSRIKLDSNVDIEMAYRITREALRSLKKAVKAARRG